MGAVLCTCGSPEDQGLNRLGYDRSGSLKVGRGVAVMGKYDVYPPKDLLKHHSLLHSRGETYTLADDAQDEGRTDGSGGRHGSAQAYADAFRAKLQETPLSPRSKFKLLSARVVTGSSMTPTESSGDSGSNTAEKAEGGPMEQRNARQKAWNSFSFPEEIRDSSMDDDDDESVTEDEWKERANPLITIIVPPGPCGLVLQVIRDDSGAPVVDGFVRKYNGRKSTIENSGLVTKGSALWAINDIDVTRMPLKEVIRTLNLSSHLERAFTFRNGFQHRNSM